MLSNDTTLVCFFCPVCRYEFGVERFRLKNGPVLCGRCHISKGIKVPVQRDFTAERANKDERVALASEF